MAELHYAARRGVRVREDVVEVGVVHPLEVLDVEQVLGLGAHLFEQLLDVLAQEVVGERQLLSCARLEAVAQLAPV